MNAIDRLGLDRWIVSNWTGHQVTVIEDPSTDTGYRRFEMSIAGLSDNSTDRPDGPPSVISNPCEDKTAIDTIRGKNYRLLDYAPFCSNCRYYANLFAVIGLPKVEMSWWIRLPLISGSVIPDDRKPSFRGL